MYNIPVFVVSMTLFPAMACVVNSTDAKPVVVPFVKDYAKYEGCKH
jgi:hypothetical protein